MKKTFSVILCLLMVISMYNLVASATTVYGTSEAGIIPVPHTDKKDENIQPTEGLPGQFQFKWEPIVSGTEQITSITILIPGTSNHVTANLHYITDDGIQLKWWLSNLSSDDPNYQVTMNWVGVKGASGYNLYDYYNESVTNPVVFGFKTTVGSEKYIGDSKLISPINNGGNTPTISHVVFALICAIVPEESSSSTTSIPDSSTPTTETSTTTSTESSEGEESESEESKASSSSEQGNSSETVISDTSTPLSGGSSSTTTSIPDDPIPKTAENNPIQVALYGLVFMTSGAVLIMLNKKKSIY